jgi:hypothetical protein
MAIPAFGSVRVGCAMSGHDHGFHFTIWVPPGFENGLQIVSKSNWDGRIAICQRAVAREALGGEALNGRVGVYVLIGTTDADGGNRVYIGRAEPLDRRLLQHEGDHEDKAFWTYVIALYRGGVELNAAEGGYLEARLIELADEARTPLTNKQRPKRPVMSAHATAAMEVFIEQVIASLETLGVRIFTSATKALAVAREQNAILFTMTLGGAQASGYDTAAGFIVRSGSSVAPTTQPSMQKGYLALRTQLLSDGSIADDGSGSLRFVRDYLFSSPSAAAAVIGGYSISGPQTWKDPRTGKSLAQIQAQGDESDVVQAD